MTTTTTTLNSVDDVRALTPGVYYIPEKQGKAGGSCIAVNPDGTINLGWVHPQGFDSWDQEPADNAEILRQIVFPVVAEKA
ncbi:MAG: hypothetical protein EOM02_10525 [Synergistales bacterium]|nr:hypothetical protein [Synergistales bacterium]